RDALRAREHGPRGVDDAAAVAAEGDSRVQQLDQRADIAVLRRRLEGGDDLALLLGAGRVSRPASFDGVPGATGELARRRWSTLDDLGDLVERVAEHVVQQEGAAL